jgi:hypothetical protein
LETAVLTAFSDTRACKHKTRRPPSAASLAEASRLRGISDTDPAARVVIDLAGYAAVAAQLNHPTASADNAAADEREELA